MPFTLIEGTFHLVGRTASGNPSGFEPDGDSMQFAPKTPALLDGLDRVGAPVRLTAIGSTQLRFEGIDALELHFDGTHQPRPLADQARDFLTGRLGMNPVPYTPPDLLRVKPPVLASKDAITGFIALEIERLQNRNYTSDEDRDLCLQQIGVLKTIHVATESLRAAIPADPKVEPDAEKIESLGRVYINLFKEWPRSNAPELVDSTCRLALVGVSVPMLTFIGVSAITAVACALVAFGGKKLLETAKLAKDVLVPGKADT